MTGNVVGPFRAVVLDLPDRPVVPAIVDGNGHFVGFITEFRNAELADTFNRNGALASIWEWRDIPEGAVER